MPTVVYTDPRFADHVAGWSHPERPERIAAVADGLAASGVVDDLLPATPTPADRAAVERVHDADYVDALERLCASGGGRLDRDTAAVEASWTAALLGAGAGLDAIERLRAGDADAAFCAVRPPGHHALPYRAMGFCLLNNVAIAAAALADAGERVAIVDFDAHHGNGTQDIFYADPRVLYVSTHEHLGWPFTGMVDEVGAGDAVGTNVNIPLPGDATGDALRQAIDQVIVPVIERFAPTWLLLSAGFDGHRLDPLIGLAFSAADYSDATARLIATVPAGRRLVFLEGGYDLQALTDSTAACVAALSGVETKPDAVSTGGSGAAFVESAARLHLRSA